MPKMKFNQFTIDRKQRFFADVFFKEFGRQSGQPRVALLLPALSGSMRRGVVSVSYNQLVDYSRGIGMDSQSHFSALSAAYICSVRAYSPLDAPIDAASRAFDFASELLGRAMEKTFNATKSAFGFATRAMAKISSAPFFKSAVNTIVVAAAASQLFISNPIPAPFTIPAPRAPPSATNAAPAIRIQMPEYAPVLLNVPQVPSLPSMTMHEFPSMEITAPRPIIYEFPSVEITAPRPFAKVFPTLDISPTVTAMHISPKVEIAAESIHLPVPATSAPSISAPTTITVPSAPSTSVPAAKTVPSPQIYVSNMESRIVANPPSSSNIDHAKYVPFIQLADETLAQADMHWRASYFIRSKKGWDTMFERLQTLAPLAVHYAGKRNVDPLLALAIAFTETNGRASKYQDGNCLGVCQNSKYIARKALMDEGFTLSEAKKIIAQLGYYDNAISINGGTYELARLLAIFGNPSLALIGYNGGGGMPKRVRDSGRLPTVFRSYLEKVYSFRQLFVDIGIADALARSGYGVPEGGAITLPIENTRPQLGNLDAELELIRANFNYSLYAKEKMKMPGYFAGQLASRGN